MALEQSILKSVKKMLGLAPDYTVFDPDVIMFTNSALSVCTQLGVGPEGGFAIEDDSAVWTTFLGSDPKLNEVKSLVYLKVRLAFDPPATSFAIASMKEQILEHEWRINAVREHVIWVDPRPVPVHELDSVLDGGSP